MRLKAVFYGRRNRSMAQRWLELIDDAAESGNLHSEQDKITACSDPAFTGLGAPYWDQMPVAQF